MYALGNGAEDAAKALLKHVNINEVDYVCNQFIPVYHTELCLCHNDISICV